MKRIVVEQNFDVMEENCCGCRTCELMCTFHHEGVTNPKRSRIHVLELSAPGRRVRRVFAPMLCRQCRYPVCVEVCPLQVVYYDEKLDVIQVDEERCNGCGLCVLTCPFGGVVIDPVKHSAVKCDLCGGDPRCVKYCPSNILKLQMDYVKPILMKELSTLKVRGAKFYDLLSEKKREGLAKFEEAAGQTVIL